jgi:hypothetical protein
MGKNTCGKHYITGYVNGRPVWKICSKRKGHLFGGCKSGG